MRTGINAVLLAIFLLVVFESSARADKTGLDYPHSSNSIINCWSCHYLTANPAAWATHNPTNPDDMPYNNQCWGCHNDVESAYVKTHSSLSTSNKYGNWTTECRDCHWVHNQPQLRDHGPAAYVYSSTSTNGDAAALTETGAGWTADQYAGYLLVPNTAEFSYNYKITGNTSDTLSVKSAMDVTKFSPGDPFAIIYGKNIKSQIITPNSGLKSVKFFQAIDNNSFAKDESDTGTDPSPDGMCQICHTKTAFWRNDGTLAATSVGTLSYTTVHGGQNGVNCMQCHPHSEGFRHGEDGTGAFCATCHNSGKHTEHLSSSFWCSACHDLNDMWESEGVIKDPRPAGLCATCHYNVDGDANSHDPGYQAGWSDPGYELGCDGCHNGRPNTADSTVMASNGHNRLVGEDWIRQYPCYYCHDDTVDAAWNLKSKHANGARDVAMADQWQIIGEDPPSYNPATKVCSNTYCHSDGTTVNPEMRDYPWNGGHQDCNACHGHDPAQAECSDCHSDGRGWDADQKWLSAMPMYANTGAGTAKANSHFRHLFTGFSCDDCHASTVVGPCLDCHSEGIPTGGMSEAQHVNGTHHVNKAKTVVFKDGGNYNEATKTCSATDCHSGTDPVWGGSVSSAITCLECHGSTEADTDDFGEFNDAQAKIDMTEWADTGHGRPAAAGNYVSGNPPAALPGIGCWYCHDNNVLHKDEDNPFRLRKHAHFTNRFQKECVYCHMVGTAAECLSCHDATESLAPQLASLGDQPEVNPPYTISRPDHIGFTDGCDNATCHVSDETRHKTDADLWTEDEKDDIENSYVMMGVCLKCHDDDAGGQCTSCHATPVDDPQTPEDESLKYAIGFDPGLAGTTYIKPQQARASSFHFGYKHYTGYTDSIAAALDTGTVSADASTLTELTDTAKNYTDNEWSGYTLMMTDGVNSDAYRKIKSNTPTRFILEKAFTNPVQSGEGYKIVDPVWKGGKFCWDCHDPHGDDNIYMIQNKVATRSDGTFGQPITRAEVVFTRKQSGLDYAKTSEPFNGICNVCHTVGTQHYGANSGDGHNAGRVCTTCHEHRFTDSHASGKTCNTCHQSKPVPRHAGFGLPRDCTKCHQGAVGMRMDIMGQLTANSHHVQQADSSVQNTDCYQCHWEATENGLIDITYHEGYNYKTHDSIKNAKVDLVIWTPYDTADSTDDYSPTVGSRPSTYTLTTDPANPNDLTTATSFLASNISGQGLAAQRTEVDKITLHCLGCHSDQNNNSQPFGDCKTPRQYAWDGSSVGSRYSNTATASWGKYTGTANAAKKDIAKAFSAHGNAVAGGGGWDASNGVDAAIPNTRAGAYNIQCFDCHSSHGSKVVGTTSSYVTFNGSKNGANLKETQAGKGGYTMSYKASANPDPNSVNPYNAGAGQCFDCHETANSGSTPWGYSETFGATAPVIGYRDNARFSGSYPGVRFPYRNSRSTTGGHLNAATDLTNPAMGTIDGLCSPCHDPHGVSASLGDDMAYGVPLLKGTWLTSPYKEDYPNTSKGSKSQRYGAKHWQTDRITFGAGAFIAEDETRFAGLCLRCHPRGNLEDGTQKNTAWKSLDRVHETVKGWGNNGEHQYPCSKCHQPHASGLPRLLQTNCLNYAHQGLQESGGTYGSNGAKRYPRSSSTGLTCHESGAAQGGLWYQQLWNDVSPW